jgi:hypothetical protein
MDIISPYNEREPMCKSTLGERASQRQILSEKKAYLSKQLDDVSAALDFLDSNPVFEKGLDILAKGLR